MRDSHLMSIRPKGLQPDSIQPRAKKPYLLTSPGQPPAGSLDAEHFFKKQDTNIDLTP